MSLYKPLPVDLIPELTLVNWRVFEVASTEWPELTRHFVGYNLTERAGRVSSAIKQFDKDLMIGVTRSGRTYEIKGKPGHNMDGMYVWDQWCKISKITKIKDVTDEYVAPKKS
jgi:hypothetical protein